MDMEKLKGLRRNLLLLSLLELVCGLFMIIMSIMNRDSIEILIVAMGIIVAAYGIVNFFSWLIKKEKDDSASAVVILVFGLLAGVMIVVFRAQVRTAFTFVCGVLAAVLGIIKLPNMFKIKKLGFEKWWAILILIAAIVGIGIVTGINAMNKGFSDNIAPVLLGVSLVLGCAADIFAMAGTSDVQKRLLDKEVDADNTEE